jgi:glycosyltransferase involved in cell wall biosynthesis
MKYLQNYYLKQYFNLKEHKFWRFEDFITHKQIVKVLEHSNHVLETINYPLLTVLITTYNHKNYISDSIESVLTQQVNFRYEIIIGDDDSTDGTREICISYANRYPDKIRLFLHHKENNISVLDKPSLIFQFGYNLYQCRGKYIAFLSGDDQWGDKYKLQKQIDFLENNLVYSYCYTPYKMLYENVTDPVNNSNKIFTNHWICTALYRNVFSHIPKSFFDIRNEDVFLEFWINTLGKGKCLDDIDPSIYMQTQTSAWSSASNLFKLKGRVLTDEKLLETFAGTINENTIRLMLYRKLFRGWRWVVKHETNQPYLNLNYFQFLGMVIRRKLIMAGIRYHINWFLLKVKNRLG